MTPHETTPAAAGEYPGERLIRQAGPGGLFALLAVSKATGHRLLARGAVGPRPVRVGGGVRYHLREVEAWLTYRRPDGGLHDAKSWPAAWLAIRKGAAR